MTGSSPDVPYSSLESIDAANFTINEDGSSSIRIVSVGGYTNHVWYMKLFGGFIKSNWVIFLVILYHLLNIAFAAWTFSPTVAVNTKNKLFCQEFEITIFAIQIQSFVLYMIAYYSLNYKNKHEIDNTLERRWISPPLCVYMIIAVPFIICIISAIISWTNSTNYFYKTRYYLQLALYILDMFKWNQIIMIVLIMHGFLNTFPEAMKQFENIIKVDARQYNGNNNDINPKKKKKNNTTITNDSNDTVLNPKYEMIQFGDIGSDFEFDTNKFKLRYNKFTKAYDQIMKHFHLFIVTFCLCICIMWGLLIYTIIISFSKKNDHCKLTNTLTSFFVHYASEIFLYFVVWAVIIHKLNRNHSLLRKYRTDFNSNVAMNSQDLLMILTFLKLKINEESPFRVYKFQPTTSKMSTLFGFIFGSLAFYIVKFAMVVDEEIIATTSSSPTVSPRFSVI